MQKRTTELLQMASALRAGRMEAVRQLAACLAHEINNPLSVILGFAQGMQRRMDDEHEFRMPVAAIVRETVRCRDLVARLATFARASARPGESADLREIVSAALEHVAPRAGAQGVQLATEVDPGIAPVGGHAAQLEQVLVDVAHNALDAMPAGGMLTIVVTPVPGAVSIEIRDTGDGIATDDLPRVFDPFFSTKGIGKGTGLGLSIAHEVVAQAGGAIEIESQVGTGTNVTITLPRAD